MELHLDLETFGEEPIKGGAHRYAEKSEIMLVALAEDDGPSWVDDLTDGRDVGAYLQRLQARIDAADKVVIHNSAFDRTVLRQHGVTIPLEKIEDTMVLALQHGLPGSLGQLCDILGVPQDEAKDKDGKKLIQLFTKPRPKNMKLRRATRETHPDEWQRFVEYARLDVDAMRAVRRRLPRWNDTPSERQYWRIDQATNDLGVAVDVELARSALGAFDRASRTLATFTAALTGGAVGATTQRDKLIAYLRETHDFVTHDMTKGTVEFFLRDGSLDPQVRKLLEIRQQAAATSPAKYKALLGAVSADGRLRGTLQFCGAARTGRDAGRIFQPQNLPRTPDWFDEDVQAITIDAIKAGCEDIIWSNVSERCSMSVRGCLVATPKHQFAIADLSNIEGRVIAWGAGEQWKLEAFRAYDRGEGPDLYKVTAGRILGKDPADVTKTERQSMGKVPELACLGPDTRVLTNSGEKPITKVTTNDLLWDGEEWVQHDGLIDRGNRETIWVAGLEATPDHELLVGRTWQPAQTVASCPSMLGHALVTGLENLPWSVWTSDLWAAYEQLLPSAHAGARPIGRTSRTSAPGATRGAALAEKSPRAAGSSGISDTPQYAPTTPTGGDCAIAYQLLSAVATTQTTRPTTTMAGVASTYTRLGVLIAVFFSRIWSRLTGGIRRSLKWTGLTSTGATSRAIFVSSGDEQTATTCGASETCKLGSKSLRPVYDIANAGPHNRFTVLTDEGALIVHNCGYQGAEGAFRVMGGPVVESMSSEAIHAIVQGWRVAHPRTKAFWYDLERACKMAIRNPGESFGVRDMATFDVVPGPDGKDWLRMRLPSGRYLCYPEPLVEQETCERCDGAGEFPFLHEGVERIMKCPHCGGSGKQGWEQISYMGVNQYTRKWSRLTTYGGKLSENWTQAVARDVFFSGMLRAYRRGYAIVLRVHDELVAEVPLGSGLTWEGLAECMATLPSWAAGLPLAAAGFDAVRYRKD